MKTMFLSVGMGIVKILIIFIPIILCIAYLTLSERKILGAIQLRKGPNVSGVFGLLQPLLDGLKLILKELLYPGRANYTLFLLAPILAFTLALIV